MSHPLLSEALKEAYASAYTEVDVIDTIELTEVGTENSLYICSGLIAQPLLLGPGVYKTFQPYPFKLSRSPGISDSGAVSVSVAVENVNGAVSAMLQTARANNRPVEVIFRTYLSNDDTAQNPRPLILELTAAEISLSGVTLTATAPDIVNKVFPNAYYSYTAYPGLRG